MVSTLDLDTSCAQKPLLEPILRCPYILFKSYETSQQALNLSFGPLRKPDTVCVTFQVYPNIKLCFEYGSHVSVDL